MAASAEPVPEPAGGKVLAGRVSASVLDQALSTATNLFITLIAARVLGVEDFGEFGVVYLVATAVAGSARNGLGSTALIFQEDALRSHAAGPLGAALAAGLGSSAVIAIAAVVGGGDLRAPLLALAVTLPGMLVQDTARLVEFAALRPVKALVLDVIWAVAMVLGLLVAGTAADLTPAAFVLAWGGAGSVSALWALWVHGRRVPRPSLAWFRHTWEYAWRYFVVFASTLGVFQVTTLILGSLSGVVAVGAVRATQVLFGPIQNLATGLMVALVPETTAETPLREQRGRLLFVSGFLTLSAGTITVVALLLPDAIGEALLGDTWAEAQALILPAGLSSMLFGVTSGAIVGLRAARAASESLVVSLQISGFQLVIPVAAAILADERGYMWSLVITWVIGSALWWRCYARLERRGGRSAALGALDGPGTKG